jgi:hypothetical protein
MTTTQQDATEDLTQIRVRVQNPFEPTEWNAGVLRAAVGPSLGHLGDVSGECGGCDGDVPLEAGQLVVVWDEGTPELGTWHAECVGVWECNPWVGSNRTYDPRRGPSA